MMLTFASADIRPNFFEPALKCMVVEAFGAKKCHKGIGPHAMFPSSTSSSHFGILLKIVEISIAEVPGV